jgi:hypothetical protein
MILGQIPTNLEAVLALEWFARQPEKEVDELCRKDPKLIFILFNTVPNVSFLWSLKI